MATIKSIFNSGIPSTSSDSLISIQRVLHSTWRIWIANIGRHTAIHQYIVVVCTTLYPPSRKPYHPLLRIRAMQSSSSRLAIVSCRNPNIYPGDWARCKYCSLSSDENPVSLYCVCPWVGWMKDSRVFSRVKTGSRRNIVVDGRRYSKVWARRCWEFKSQFDSFIHPLIHRVTCFREPNPVPSSSSIHLVLLCRATTHYTRLYLHQMYQITPYHSLHAMCRRSLVSFVVALF